jgi:hypothetical protein
VTQMDRAHPARQDLWRSGEEKARQLPAPDLNCAELRSPVGLITSIGQGSVGAVTDRAAARFRVWCLFAVWTAVACAARRARVRTGSDRAGMMLLSCR